MTPVPPPDPAPRLALVAGEASGDLLAAVLLRACRSRWPLLRAAGIGGPRMQREGFEAWWPSERLAVRGYVEVLRRYREIVGIRRQLRQRLLSERPDVLIGVDAPDFNLELEADLRRHGVRTVHYVCPSIWAWRPHRVHRLREAADHVLCIFPFEAPMLAQHGIAATYVGHPLAPLIPRVPDRTAARKALGLPTHGIVVALLPGSRAAEIQHLAQRFFSAAARMNAERGAIHFIAPAAPGLMSAVKAAAVASGLPSAVLTVLDGQSHEALAACDVALVASGTATLEAALYKRPMVIAYHMNAMSWWITQRKRLQPWVGLPNILCGEFVVPELLQEAATPAALADAVLTWLDAPEKMAAVSARFSALHDELERPTDQLVSDAIQSLLQR